MTQADDMDTLDDSKNTGAGNETGAGNAGENDITPEERDLLDSSFEDDEERGLHSAELDDTDEDGELLNEKTSATSIAGTDLDVPGAGDDDADEDLGEEDEENNSYSLPDQGDNE